MNIAEIQEAFIRAAEIERASREHVGPAQPKSVALPYIHSQADKNGWRKEPGDKLVVGEDPLADERKAFWERIGIQPSAHELSELEVLYAWLTSIENEKERRALLAWARSRVGGKSFRRWCFTTEGIHPETGRRRKDRALAKIHANLIRKPRQDDESGEIRVLLSGAKIDDVSGTVEEDAGKREGLNSWAADDAFEPFVAVYTKSFGKEVAAPKGAFSWAAKRNERRRAEAKKRPKKSA
ncbi:hypothetical protein [Mesorhizobium sp.]|uniref:hypothetical protein n=1 Tax=Mesorhizobium sp. TaxID=1871066 RepID=UPI00120843B1|nr:hypothetical protein [Mesorhizobium sp.]TIM09154.1 MAG: hypothetical protein E5Y62_13430 [Mesorhizobium sp.]